MSSRGATFRPAHTLVFALLLVAQGCAGRHGGALPPTASGDQKGTAVEP